MQGGAGCASRSRPAAFRRYRPAARPAGLHRDARGTAQRRTRPAAASAPDHDDTALAEYEELLSGVFQAQGLNRMGSRVLTCLFLSDDGALTAAELTRHLQVSPATVSKAIAFLESQTLVRRERIDGRRDRYLVDPELFYQATIASARSHDQLIARRSTGPGWAPAPPQRRGGAGATQVARSPHTTGAGPPPEGSRDVGLLRVTPAGAGTARRSR
ncbi:hypothetical protein GCM10009751_32560 [Myceligenerans crystallogenes]|uniref:HTH marR-type domain-containing protein n=1 Tax=Myceligenerans crystallogenes TaxID=316335 RepID=A0ABP4ZT79_9MICO